MKTETKQKYSKSLVLVPVLTLILMGTFSLALTCSVHSASLAAPDQNVLAGLEITQAGPDAAFVDDLITYTLILTNGTSSSISGIVINDTWATKLPQDITKLWQYGILALYEGYTVSPQNAVISMTYYVNSVNRRGETVFYLNPVAAGGVVQIELSARVPITLQPALKSYEPIPGTTAREEIGPSDVENTVTAVVQDTETSAGLVTTQIFGPILSFTRNAVGEVAGEGYCRVGRLVTYTIVLKNSAKSVRLDTYPARHLQVHDTLPTQLQNMFVSAGASVAGVTVTETDGVVTWVFADNFVLASGAEVTLTLVGRVPHDAEYGPYPKYLISEWEKLTAHADAMPFRDAAVQSDYRVRILSPFDKSVLTGSPPADATTTFPNRVITYTLTFYNPMYDHAISAVVLEDGLPRTAEVPDIFTFQQMVAGDLGLPVSTENSVVRWENVTVLANGVTWGTFEVHVSAQTPVKKRCRELDYTNAVTATVEGLTYLGHDSNKLATVSVTPQLIFAKTATPETQIVGSEITYTISIENIGDTTIQPPLVLTDTTDSSMEFSRMVSTPPGPPTLVSSTPELHIYQWDNVLSEPLVPGGTVEVAYRITPTLSSEDSFVNQITGYNSGTSVCLVEEEVIIEPAIRYTKEALPEIVVQGEVLTYTVQIFNLSPRSVFTLTQFADILDNDQKGTTDFIDGDGLYEYTLPTPFRLDPMGAAWEHSFRARMTGYGIGETWCENLEAPTKGTIYQLGYDILARIEWPDRWVWGYEDDKVAPVCVLPKYSLYQKAYPNPLAVGQVFTVVLTIRDNRTVPSGNLTGVQLDWTFPLAESTSDGTIGPFVVLDSSVTPSQIGSGFYVWNNLIVPQGGKTEIVLHMLAPLFEKDGWSKTYSDKFVARVTSLPDASICIPPAGEFATDDTFQTSCEGRTSRLAMNQGIELDKHATPTQVPPYGLVTYELTVKNLTGAPVSNVVVTDVLPSFNNMYWQYVKMVDGPEPITTNPLVWEVDNVPALDKVEWTFVARAHQFLGTEYNQITATAPIHVGLNKDYLKHVMVQVISGIGLFKVASPDRIESGQPTTYTLTLYNGSKDVLTRVFITDTLPTGFTYTHMIEPVGLPPVKIDGQDVVWSIPGDVAVNQTYELVFGVTTDPELFDGYYYSNLSASGKKAAIGEAALLPASEGIAPVYVRGKPQVLVDKQVDPATVRADREVTYTLTLFNETDSAQSLVVTDTLPAELNFVAVVGGTPSPTIIPGERDSLVWQGLGTIQPSQTFTLTFRAIPDLETISGLYCNDVQVLMSSRLLPKRTPASGCVHVTQIPHVDVQVSKSDGVVEILEGDTLSYTIYYTNSFESEVALDTIIITDTMWPSAYMTPVVGLDWTQVGDSYVFQGGPLQPGESGQAALSAIVAAEVPTQVLVVENRVTVGYTTTDKTIEVEVEDNYAVDRDFLNAPDLVVTSVQVSPSLEIKTGDPLTVTVVAENQGRDPIYQRWDGSQSDPYELFAVEVYFRPPGQPPTDVFDHAGGWDRGDEYIVWIDGRLAPGESDTVQFHLTAPEGGSYDLYAQADTGIAGTGSTGYFGQLWGLIWEPNEANNLSAAYPLSIIGHAELYLPVVMRQY
jgi:uncharacterized repeat protein (TIGR01451 family)